MICKNCQKEMPDVGDFCPFCAAPKETETVQPENLTEDAVALEEIVFDEAAPEEEAIPDAAPRKKKWPLILGIVGGAVLLLALITFLVGYILNTMGILDLKPRSNDITYKASYAVEDEKAIKNADKVVAELGGRQLTNGQLQFLYQNEIYSFYNQYYYYASYIGLDLTQPLDQQQCMMDEGKTWEQYFLQRALSSWEQYVLLSLLAEEEGHQIDPELLTSLEGMPAEMESYATENGYESVDAFISDQYGVNVDMDDYMGVYEMYLAAGDYENHIYDTQYPTAEEIEAYYVENEATFAEQSITRDMGLQSSVRHILIAPEIEETEEATEEPAGEAGEEPVETAAEAAEEATEETLSPAEQAAWDAALLEAQTLLDTWKAGEATEDSFIALVAGNTDDTASIESGGLYEGVNADSSYVPEFLAWAIDSVRRPGDTDVVKTDYGYHIMYFVSGEDYWSILVGEQVVVDHIQQLLQQAQETYPTKYHYKNIFLAQTESA